MAGYPFHREETPFHITVSVGVSQYDAQTDQTPGDLLEKADKALYKAKQAGRNRVMRRSD